MANTEPHVDSAGGSGEVMDRWKTDNCESGGDRLSSRSTSLSRRLIGLAGVAALTVGGAGAVLLGAGAAYAATVTLTSNQYQIGSGQISGLTVTPGSSYMVKFTATDGVSTSSGTAVGSVVVNLNATGFAAASYNVIVAVNGVQTGIVSTSVSSSGAATVTLPTIVAAGASVQLDFVGLANPTETTATSETAEVSTSNDSIPVSANYTIPAAAASYGVSASSYAFGASPVTYTVGPINVTATSSLGTLTLTSTSSSVASGAVTAAFPQPSTDYTVSVTTSAGATSSDVVTGATPVAPATGTTTVASTSSVALALTTAVVTGDTVNVTVDGVINGNATGGNEVITNSFNASESATVDLGTSVSSVSASFVPSTGTSATVSAGLVVGFTTTTALASTDSVTLSIPAGIGDTVADNLVSVTVGSGTSAATSTATVTYNPATAVTTANTTGFTVSVPLSSPGAIAAATPVTIELFGLSVPATNSPGSNYSVGVSTSTDSLVAKATANETLSTTSNGVTVNLSNNALGANSTYSIGNLQTTAAIAAATANSADEFVVTFPSGTVLPTALSNYEITDATNSAASAIPTSASVSGTTVTIEPSVAMASGDSFSITVSGAINPTTAGLDTLSVGGYVQSVQVSASASAPTAATTYPNGAFVQSGGQVDVIAGGVGFGIPTLAKYDLIAATDSSQVVSGSFPTATTVRAGTLLQVVGMPAIYVVGTNGDAYAFSTPTEFTSDGYSAKSVVSVPSLGSLTTGSGAAPTAAVTMPDGALVQSGSTIYVYAGGKAFGIPTWSEYQTIAAATGSSVVQGTVSNTSATSLTAGTLIQPIGSFGIWVSDGTSIYQFSTASQFASDGYNGANVVPVPNATGLTQA